MISILVVIAVVLSGASASSFDVTSFGAVGDGVHDCTLAIRRAAAAVAENGGGTLLFPRSSTTSLTTYLSGSFNVTSHTIVRVEAGVTILGHSKGELWPLVDPNRVWPQFGHGSDCTPGDEDCRLMHQALIFSWNSTNITLSGGGTVDGNGASWWQGCAGDLSKPPCSGHARPHLVFISSASNIRLLDLTFRNSPDWSLHMSSVSNLRVKNVKVLAPALHAPNTDGIDLDCVQDAIVEDSEFSVGDDALCVKSGWNV